MLDLSTVNANAGRLYRYRHILRREVGGILGNARLIKERRDALAKAAEIDRVRHQLARAADAYDPAFDVAYWRKSQTNAAAQAPQQVNRNALSLELIGQCVEGADKLVNFGCGYPILELEALKRFPDLQIYGLDRYPEITALNAEHFGAVSNRLHFITSGEFLACANSKPDFLRGAIIHHTYTMIFMTERFMYDFYKALHLAGVEYITCLEFTGLSRETLTYFEHSHRYTPSAYFLGDYAMHNYPHMMAEAGYEVVHAEARRRETNAEWREVAFVGKRR